MPKPIRSAADVLHDAEAAKPAKPGAQLGWVPMPLPSRGVLYEDKLPGGIVQMRKMMSAEMSRLQSQGGSVMDKIEAVVRACARFPEGFDQGDLLLTDSFFMMLSLRTLSFGPEYTYRFRCRYCGSQERAHVNIAADLEEKTPSEGLVEPIEVPLIDANCIVGMRFMRERDSTLVTQYAKRMRMTTLDQDDPSHQYRLAITLVHRDGEPFTSVLAKQDFIRSLTAADIVRLERGIADKETGVDIRVFPDCQACGATNEMSLPFDAEFFRPSAL